MRYAYLSGRLIDVPLFSHGTRYMITSEAVSPSCYGEKLDNLVMSLRDLSPSSASESAKVPATHCRYTALRVVYVYCRLNGSMVGSGAPWSGERLIYIKRAPCLMQRLYVYCTSPGLEFSSRW